MSSKVTCLKDDAQTLAVAYSAYNAATQRGEWPDALYWFDMLVEAQEATGVELVKPDRRVMLVPLVENYEWSEWGCDLPEQSVAQH